MFKTKLIKQSVLLLLVLAALASTPKAEFLDPTMPSQFSSVMTDDTGMQGSDEMALQAIYYRSSGSSVMINGRLYRVNDQLAEYTIKSIMPDKVILAGYQGDKTISFTRMPVKFRDEASASSQVKE